jgi:hypothetical protein
MLSCLESECEIATDHDPFKPTSGDICIPDSPEARNRTGRRFLERCQSHAPHVKEVYDLYITRRKKTKPGGNSSSLFPEIDECYP